MRSWSDDRDGHEPTPPATIWISAAVIIAALALTYVITFIAG